MFTKQLRELSKNGFLNAAITIAEDERTVIAKGSNTKHQPAIDVAHSGTAKTIPTIIQRGRNVGYIAVSALKRVIDKLTGNKVNGNDHGHVTGGFSNHGTSSKGRERSANWRQSTGIASSNTSTATASEGDQNNNAAPLQPAGT